MPVVAMLGQAAGTHPGSTLPIIPGTTLGTTPGISDIMAGTVAGTMIPGTMAIMDGVIPITTMAGMIPGTMVTITAGVVTMAVAAAITATPMLVPSTVAVPPAPVCMALAMVAK